jgi:transposase
MSEKLNSEIAVIGIDIGKNSFHLVGQDRRGRIVLRQKWSRGQVEAQLANLPARLIGMEACVGAHHLSRKLKALGHASASGEVIATASLDGLRARHASARAGRDEGTARQHEQRNSAKQKIIDKIA